MKSVFFYGLFMDETLLKSKGLNPSKPILGYVDGYSLIIGERATLIKETNEKAYGAIIELSEEEISRLYEDTSVADYVPEKVTVILLENEHKEAIVYNLPSEKLKGNNSQYAKSLLKLAQRYGLPSSYLKKIEAFTE